MDMDNYGLDFVIWIFWPPLVVYRENRVQWVVMHWVFLEASLIKLNSYLQKPTNTSNR